VSGRRYAEGTYVPATQTRQEIERVVQRYGASKFASGWADDTAVVEFVVNDRRIRFRVPLDCDEREQRRRWRSLLLAIKSRLDVVASGIETFDEAFLAHIVGPDDMTIYQHAMGSARLLGPVQ